MLKTSRQCGTDHGLETVDFNGLLGVIEKRLFRFISNVCEVKQLVSLELLLSCNYKILQALEVEFI